MGELDAGGTGLERSEYNSRNRWKDSRRFVIVEMNHGKIIIDAIFFGPTQLISNILCFVAINERIYALDAADAAHEDVCIKKQAKMARINLER